MTPPGGEPHQLYITLSSDDEEESIIVRQTILHTPGEPPFINDIDDTISLKSNIDNLISREFFQNGNVINDDELIKKYIDKKTAKKIIKINSNCKCCIRHSINRPCNIHDNLSVTGNNQYNSGENMKNYIDYNTCQCTCRHWNRYLIRIFEND
tara:strand:- start:10 stop:468 length:459 start_codon:yes stop_codon:yes gene_type:complete